MHKSFSREKTRKNYWSICRTLAAYILLGCSTASASAKLPQKMNTTPDDFMLVYKWIAGSMPPPYHYEYLIRLQPSGQGEVIFWPDYPSNKAPEWQETFISSSTQLNHLYQVMITQGLFTETWQAQIPSSLGGSREHMTVTANKRQVEIPECVIPEQAARVDEIYKTLRGIVPQVIWDKLEAQRQKYMNTHGD